MRGDQDQPLQIPQQIYEEEQQQHLKLSQKPKKEQLQNQHAESKANSSLNFSNREYYFFKICVFILVIGVLLLGKVTAVPSKEYPIIHDPVMYTWLSSMNEEVNINESTAKALQISSGICMDLSFLMLFGYWVVRIKTGRLLYATAAFYIFRIIIQQFVIFPFPKGFYWVDPGFPSLTVPYGRTSDFFWSGHCGFLAVVACEWFVQQRIFMFVITCIVNLYMSIVMIGFRIHYTVDIIMGIIMAHYTFILFSKAAPYIDGWIYKLFSFIQNKFKRVYIKQKENQQMQQQNINPSVQVHNRVSVEENRA